jgi:hypothetical protein
MSRFGPGAADAALRSGINDFLGANSFANFPLNLLIGQLKFPATQNPSSDANTMDDYDEGSWTPVIGGSGGESGQTYANQNGYYIKLGQLVLCLFNVGLSVKGTITSQVRIKGIPFTISSLTNVDCPYAASFQNLATNWVEIIFRAAAGEVVFRVTGNTAAAATNGTNLVTADIADNTIFRGAVMFRSDS